MAIDQFQRYYEEFIPKQDKLRDELEAAPDERTFAKIAVQQGKDNGFNFSEEEAFAAMSAAEKKVSLEPQGVLTIRSVSSVRAIQERARVGSTVMCCW